MVKNEEGEGDKEDLGSNMSNKLQTILEKRLAEEKGREESSKSKQEEDKAKHSKSRVPIVESGVPFDLADFKAQVNPGRRSLTKQRRGSVPLSHAVSVREDALYFSKTRKSFLPMPKPALKSPDKHMIAKRPKS